MWKAVFFLFCFVCLTCAFFKVQVWHLRNRNPCSFIGKSEASHAHEIAKTVVALFEKFKKHLTENDSLVLLCSTALPDYAHEILPWPAVWNPSIAFPPLLWPAWPASETHRYRSEGKSQIFSHSCSFNNIGSANVCTNLKEPEKLSTLLRCRNAVDSPLTEGKQVPLPQSTNDPIISIRSHDWCYTPLLLLSSSPHIQAPPKSHLDWGLRAPSSTVEAAEGGGVDCGRGFEVWIKTIRPFYAKPGFSFISTLGSHWKEPY